MTASGVILGMVGSEIDCLWVWGSLGGCVSLLRLRRGCSSLCGRGSGVVGPVGVVAGWFSAVGCVGPDCGSCLWFRGVVGVRFPIFG